MINIKRKTVYPTPSSAISIQSGSIWRPLRRRRKWKSHRHIHPRLSVNAITAARCTWQMQSPFLSELLCFHVTSFITADILVSKVTQYRHRHWLDILLILLRCSRYIDGHFNRLACSSTLWNFASFFFKKNVPFGLSVNKVIHFRLSHTKDKWSAPHRLAP